MTVLFRKSLLTIATLVLLCSTSVFASVPSLNIVYDQKSRLFSDIAAQLGRKYSEAHLMTLEDRFEDVHANGLVVSIGTEAAEHAIANTAATSDKKILATFVSSLNYYRVLRKYHRVEDSSISAIFIDPSFRNQFELVKQIFPNNPSVVVFLKPESSFIERALVASALDSGVKLKLLDHESDKNMLKSLSKQKGISALLSVADSDVINLNNYRSVLEVAYSADIGVIGYSQAMVKAGAAAASYVEINDMIGAIHAQISGFKEDGHLGVPRYFDHMQIAVNSILLESMNIVTKDFEFIREEVAKNVGKEVLKNNLDNLQW